MAELIQRSGPSGGLCTKEERHISPASIVINNARKRKGDSFSPEDHVLPRFNERQLTTRKPRSSGIASEECISHTTIGRRCQDPTEQLKKVRFDTSLEASPRRKVSQVQGSKAEPWLSAQNLSGFVEGKENTSWPSPVSLGNVSVKGFTSRPLTSELDLHIIRGRESLATDQLASASTAINSVSVSSPLPVSTLPALKDCSDTMKNDPGLSTDSQVVYHWGSEETYQEDSEASWAEVSSEEEVELELDFDSDAENPGISDEEVRDAGDGKSHDWIFQSHEENQTKWDPKHRDILPISHELMQYLFPEKRENARVPIKCLLETDTRHLRAALVQSRTTYKGEKIIFSRAI